MKLVRINWRRDLEDWRGWAEQWASGEYTSSAHESSRRKDTVDSELEVGKAWISPHAHSPKWNTKRCSPDKHTTFCARCLLTKRLTVLAVIIWSIVVASAKLVSFSFPPSHPEKKCVVVGLGQQLLLDNIALVEMTGFWLDWMSHSVYYSNLLAWCMTDQRTHLAVLGYLWERQPGCESFMFLCRHSTPQE